MKLFKFENYKLEIDPIAYTLIPFKDIIEKDKSKNKELAFKELAFIYHYSDLKSDFHIITDDNEKIEAIKLRVGLNDKWVPDSKVITAISFYKERTITPSMQIYLDAMKGAIDTGKYLANSGVLLAERDEKGRLITTPAMVASSLKTTKELIKDLKIIEQEVIREKSNLSEKTKGSQTFNIYEDGKGILDDV